MERSRVSDTLFAMPLVPLEFDPAQLLPGTWRVNATNFPMWLSGDRLSPRFTYGVIATDPLALSDDVSYTTAEGEEKHILGTDKWANGVFTWRGKGLLAIAKSRWSVIGMSTDAAVVVIRFERTRVTPAGIDILVRDGVSRPELRTFIAHNAEKFGLSAEDFASLSWLRQSDGPGAV